MSNSVHNVLWTSGWDSTFRVIQLYRNNCTIQPIYVRDHNRKSTQREFETIQSLTSSIQDHFSTSKGSILPLIIYERKKIPSNFRLKFAYNILRKRKNLGKQYYWLAFLAKKYNRLELSIHKGDLYRFFNLDELIVINQGASGENWVINKKKVDIFRKLLFGNMTFPIVNISKPEMKKIAEDYNFSNLMEQTWFCHRSGSKACGECSPCKQYRRDGFGYRIDQVNL
ncbi:7-cyano-7-deazaguanine synthase [Dokdonia sp. Hel_I_53]|uniref:7-cyano-7-deazaguanine synthase n=1 Tax=Dokdonia sp. Hel_I_53 TaxID=1566287 RepID=UPI00119928DB|nr:7-cyano-7-deazaguanine synthase [Dokdonia sp. Hel_I_53]TVZ50917.1 7-cyano-7-deazaguanine synthase [Dokdonia sp. Hel_I_53]